MTNNVKVEIWSDKTKEWVDFTRYCVFSPKGSLLLDKRLDEAFIRLTRCPYSYFKPLTEVKVTLSVESPKMLQPINYYDTFLRNRQGLTCSQDYTNDKIRQTNSTVYVVSEDQATLSPAYNLVKFGQTVKTYNHEIFLLEMTKFTEGFVGDSLTVTNALGNTYV